MRNQTRPEGCCVPSRFTLYCRVPTSSPTSSKQREKLSLAPLSFNIPNTSAWNNWCQHLSLPSLGLLFSLFILPFALKSHVTSLRFWAFLLPHPHTLLSNCTVKTAQSDVILSVSSLLTTLSWSLVLKHRNWYPSSSTSQKCLSTAMATI